MYYHAVWKVEKQGRRRKEEDDERQGGGGREGAREAGRREVQGRTKGVMINGVMYLQGKEERKRERQRKCTNKSAQIKCAKRERERERESVCVCVYTRKMPTRRVSA